LAGQTLPQASQQLHAFAGLTDLPDAAGLVLHAHPPANTTIAAVAKARNIDRIMKIFNHIFAGFAILFAAGCAMNQTSMTKEYSAALASLPGADLAPSAEKAAVQRVKTYLSNLRADEVRANTQRVYAADAYFNDTLKTHHGAAEIEKYFLASVANTDGIEVEFADVAKSNEDYYFRWVMDVKLKYFAPGKTVRSIGMSHIRFNRDGQVILHQDYWDSAAGLFEYVPIVGTGIRLIKSRL
jgi:limonene-1,2-epoxide hydrolase